MMLSLSSAEKGMLLKLCAVAKYNTERVRLTETMIKEFLQKPVVKYDIKGRAEDIQKAADDERKKLIEKQETMNIPVEEHLLVKQFTGMQGLTYVEERYFPYNELFKNKHGFDIQYTAIFATLLIAHITDKARTLAFTDPPYAYKDKKEYMTLSHVAIPQESYVDRWSQIIQFSFQELMQEIPKNMHGKESVEIFNRILEMYLIDVADLKADANFMFFKRPILQIDEDKYIIIDTTYLLRSLPLKMELLLKECPSYSDVRGETFEAIALKLLAELPDSNLQPNIKYKVDEKRYELDGLLNLKSSSWFVECSSHMLNEKAIAGDEGALENDFFLSVEKCQNQAIRAIENRNHPSIRQYKPKSDTGVIVIVEGAYPPLNSRWRAFVPEISQPRWIVSYSDLEVLSKQDDLHLLEDFLKWRTQKNMPVLCYDELDYWAYFAGMQGEKEKEEGFHIAQERNISVFYISQRFNDKRYLSRMYQQPN